METALYIIVVLQALVYPVLYFVVVVLLKHSSATSTIREDIAAMKGTITASKDIQEIRDIALKNKEEIEALKKRK